jgi:putative glycosyltransferase (TIGR04372 family)
MTAASQFRARLRARLERAEREGAVRTLLQLLEFTASALVWLVLLPLTLGLHAAGFRRLTVLTGRIGHLAAEPDAFLKALALGMVPPGRYFLSAPANAVANETMLAYWAAHLPVVRGRIPAWILAAMSRWGLMRHDMSGYILKIGASQKIYAINARWDARAPLLQLTAADLAWSEASFAELGLPSGSWFACVHVREAGFSPEDEAAHAHRNADPRAVRAAMEEIAHRGGWCVRMGDPTMTPLEPMAQVIDYAHHRLRSARMDVLLCARAHFFLGNTSGLALVSSVFGVPSALANLIPLSVLGILPRDISIAKLLRDRSTGRMLTFGEVLAGPVGDYRYASLYEEAGVQAVENTPEEIADMVREMLDRIDGRHMPTPEDEALQRRFISLLRPGHYSYGASSRVGAAFLRRHRALLPSG